MDVETIGVFLDFENLAVSAERAYPSREKPLKLLPVIDYINTLGNVLLKRAYANWSRPIYYQYQQDLSNNGFELLHLPETTSQGKNGSDVKLAIDLMEHMELYGTISTYIVGSGDSDFIPLIQSIRKRGKRVVVIGFNSSVGHVVKMVCNEFKAMEDFIGRNEADLNIEDEPGLELKHARDLLIRYSRNLEEEELGVHLSKLKLDLKRLDPSFSERKCGFVSFKQFVVSFEGDILEVKEDPENKGSYIAYFNDRTRVSQDESNQLEEAAQHLSKWGHIEDMKDREFVSKRLVEVMKKEEHPSLIDLIDAIYDGRKRIAKKKIHKFLLTLYHENVFRQINESYQGPLNTRWFELRRTGIDSEGVLGYYMDGTKKMLKDRFPDLTKEEIEDLLEK